jgi:hypothetical protein
MVVLQGPDQVVVVKPHKKTGINDHIPVSKKNFWLLFSFGKSPCYFFPIDHIEKG